MSNAEKHDGSLEAAAARAAASRAREAAARGESTQASVQVSSVPEPVTGFQTFIFFLVIAGILGILAAITGICVAVANGSRGSWEQLGFWDGIPLMWAFVTNPVTVVIGIVLTLGILVAVFGRDAKCPHCGVKTDSRYRVCKSCGRVKANG